MKKQILMVSALVMVALSSMLVACDKKEKDAASNGCTCTYEDGDKETYTQAELKEEGIPNCSALSQYLSYYEDETVTCK